MKDTNSRSESTADGGPHRDVQVGAKVYTAPPRRAVPIWMMILLVVLAIAFTLVLFQVIR